MIIPTREECLKILKENNVPDNVIAHCKAVCDFSMKIVDLLEKKGINVNRDLVAAGALLHDIKKINSDDHIIEGYEFIKSLGFSEVALLIKKHGLYHLENEDFVPKTWEEKAVFYADKRVKNDKIVSINERFEYIKQRYKKDDVEKEIMFTKKIEKELLGDEKLQKLAH
ncbi:HD domain-containing protein [Candidatus Woesearchaeota archaeon]|nr:HD domain-containing protein [Candidatus Woesearchaeota archaeon]